MENYNKEWLNSANSYRPDEGANRLADEIHDVMHTLRLGVADVYEETLQALPRLQAKCLEFAPLVSRSPEDDRSLVDDRQEVLGEHENEWLEAERKLRELGEIIRQDTFEDVAAWRISVLVYRAANRSVPRESGGE